jgi:hypothetical protein
MNLDEITYGNPDRTQLQFINKESYLDYLFEELSQYTFPVNSSQATKEELNTLVDATNLLEKNKDEFLPKYKAFDINLSKYFKTGLIKGGEPEDKVNKLIDRLLDETKPLLTKLKFHFQRPRPYQLAEYYKLKLFPFEAHSSHSPSFPSGHAYQGRIITEVLGNLYPSSYSFMQGVFEEICYSRLYMGLHYQSDIDVAIFCADKVLQDKQFKTNFAL